MLSLGTVLLLIVLLSLSATMVLMIPIRTISACGKKRELHKRVFKSPCRTSAGALLLEENYFKNLRSSVEFLPDSILYIVFPG